MTDASVILWGRRIGAVSWDAERALGVFQHDPVFAAAGIELAPFVMPAREAPYEFPALGRDAFKGLPGLLADALNPSRGCQSDDQRRDRSGGGLATPRQGGRCPAKRHSPDRRGAQNQGAGWIKERGGHVAALLQRKVAGVDQAMSRPSSIVRR
ncbi:MAG: hypothetical protein F4109_08360 [Gammaproteobacteria bacterium]|nr:hypothetical protein [Gammaproteobacteria bacterium]MYD02074.1 hypothetical protein [Gammaproteobacteria bacterium]MYI25425.1 hypothetical protein [Gammaproteobacteria bacterium]